MRPEERSAAEAVVHQEVERLGYEVLNLSVGNDRKLCLTLDRDGAPITIDDVTKINWKLRDALAKGGLNADDYQVEVESPGIMRPLKTARHFVRFVGERAKVKLKIAGPDGNRVLVGMIHGVEGSTLNLLVGKKKLIPVPLDNVATATLDPDFESRPW